MRKVHKNILFETIMKCRFDVNSFNLTEDTGQQGGNTTIVLFKNSPFKFIVEPFPADFNAYKVSYVTYGPKYPIATVGGGTLKIEDVIKHFINWLDNQVQHFIDDKNATDLWEEYKNGVNYLIIDDIKIEDTSTFSTDDQKRIIFAIEDLKALIPQKFNISTEQQIMINAKLDYLIEALPRLRKTDWKGVAIGIIASIIIALSLDTERGHQFWELFRQVFRIIPLIGF